MDTSCVVNELCGIEETTYLTPKNYFCYKNKYHKMNKSSKKTLNFLFSFQEIMMTVPHMCIEHKKTLINRMNYFSFRTAAAMLAI